MAVLKVLEILSSSTESWEDATKKGVAKASESIKHVKSAYVNEMSTVVEDGKVTEFRVNLKVTFVVE